MSSEKGEPGKKISEVLDLVQESNPDWDSPQTLIDFIAARAENLICQQCTVSVGHSDAKLCMGRKRHVAEKICYWRSSKNCCVKVISSTALTSGFPSTSCGASRTAHDVGLYKTWIILESYFKLCLQYYRKRSELHQERRQDEREVYLSLFHPTGFFEVYAIVILGPLLLMKIWTHCVVIINNRY